MNDLSCLNNKINNKIELLAPAGNLEKLKIAFLYGADAVYAGGKYFSLRARANNFDLDDIKEGAKFAKTFGKKLYITMNIVPHNDDLENLINYLKYLEECEVTGIIVSSLYIAKMAKVHAPKLERHLSTQASVNNSNAVKYYEDLGFSRVVLAREVDIKDIKTIKQKTSAELEVFIHGGMCTSFSGRCMLSNYMTKRDANRGGCAHSCRWNYDVYQNNNKLTDSYLNIGSKDLCAVKLVGKLIKAGVSSLKIEGRMKSLYYIATVVRAYRNLIDDYYRSFEDKDFKIDYKYYQKEILRAENRLTSTGFLKGKVTVNEQLYNDQTLIPTKDFLGVVLNYDEKSQFLTLQQRNYFEPNEKVEFIGPTFNLSDKKSLSFIIDKIYDEDGNELEACRHPLQIIKFKVPFKLNKDDIMRKNNC